MDVIGSAIGKWAIAKVVKSATGVAGGMRDVRKLCRKLDAAFEDWKRQTTVAEDVTATMFLGTVLEGTARPTPAFDRLQSSMADGEPPDRHVWENALFERWEHVGEQPCRSALVPFFRIDPEAAKSELVNLARLFGDVCRKEALFFTGLVRADLAAVRQKTDVIAASLHLAIGYQGDAAAELKHITHECMEGDPRKCEGIAESLIRSQRPLSPEQQVRLCEIRGLAYVQQEMYEAAAGVWIEAATFDPCDLKALALRALGYAYIGNLKQGLEIATDLCARHPESARAHFVRLKASGDDIAYEAALASVPKSVASDPEICLHLAYLALTQGSVDAAERLARRAAEADPAFGAARSVLATSLLSQERDVVFAVGVGEPDPRESKNLGEAEDLLNELISSRGYAHASAARSVHYRNRAAVRFIRGNRSEARLDIGRAFEADPSDREARCAYMLLLNELGDSDRAVSIAREASGFDQPNDQLRIALAMSLLSRGNARDADEVRCIAEAALDVPDGELDEASAIQLLRLYGSALASTSTRSARDCMSMTEGLGRKAGIDELVVCSVLAELAVRLGDVGVANKAADRCVDAVKEGRSPSTYELVADALARVGRHEAAVEYWDRAVDGRWVGTTTRRALLSAHRAGTDDARGFILRVCARAREAGAINELLSRLEVACLAHYREWQSAIGLIVEAKESVRAFEHIEVLELVIRASAGEDVSECLSKLPSPDSVDPATGFNVVQLLVHARRSVDAAQYAYVLYKNYGDEPLAARALVVSHINPGVVFPDKGRYAEPDAVLPGHAVLFVELGGRERVAIVEDVGEPDIERDEYAPDHPLSQALLGGRAGDVVGVPGGAGQRKARIRRILPASAYRAHRLAEMWESRYPEDQLVTSLAVPISTDGGRHEPDFGEVEEVLRGIETRRRGAERVYARNPVPVCVFAEANGKGVIETMGYLCEAPDMPIRSAFVGEGLEEATENIASMDGLVCDGTSIGTLVTLGEVGVIGKMGLRVVVPSAVLEEVVSAIREIDVALTSGEDRLTVSSHEGQIYKNVEPRDRLEGRREELSNALDIIRESADIVGGLSVLSLGSEYRRKLARFADTGTTHAIAIARDEGLGFWTDDVVIASIAADGQCVPRVATQHALVYLGQVGLIPFDRMHVCFSRMVAYGYEGIRLWSQTVVAALRSCLWDVDAERSRAVLGQALSPRTTGRFAVAVVLDILRNVWRESELVERAQVCSRKVCEFVASRHDADAIIVTVIRNIPGAFGVNVLRADQAIAVLKSWRRGLLDSVGSGGQGTGAG